MSSEYTSNETTPLRSDVVINSSPRDLNSINSNNSNNNNNNLIHNFQLDTSILMSNNNNNNFNNNHQTTNMDSNRRIILKVAFDFGILLCVGLPILGFYLWGEPYKRGFFCDDESLRHPFHESTVKNYMLYIIGLILPVCIIVPMEFFYNRHNSHTLKFLDWNVPAWLVGAYKQVGVFGFGAASQQLVVDIAKYSIGRLRPHFIDVCQPVLPDGTTCSDVQNHNRYIEQFTCTSINSTPRMLKEMRLSFPSGHSSFSAFAMIYCVIYLQSRMNWSRSKLLRHFIQFLLISLAWFTALSRISDYKHHWSDVLSGSLIGTLGAIIVSQCVSDLFDKNAIRKHQQQTYLPQTRQDTTTTTTQLQATNNGRA